MRRSAGAARVRYRGSTPVSSAALRARTSAREAVPLGSVEASKVEAMKATSGARVRRAGVVVAPAVTRERPTSRGVAETSAVQLSA